MNVIYYRFSGLKVIKVLCGRGGAILWTQQMRVFSLGTWVLLPGFPLELWNHDASVTFAGNTIGHFLHMVMKFMGKINDLVAFYSILTLAR